MTNRVAGRVSSTSGTAARKTSSPLTGSWADSVPTSAPGVKGPDPFDLGPLLSDPILVETAEAETLGMIGYAYVVEASGAGGQQKARPLWTWLLVVAALAFFAEGLLLRK